jgi:hypothetical protein
VTGSLSTEFGVFVIIIHWLHFMNMTFDQLAALSNVFIFQSLCSFALRLVLVVCLV